MLNLSSASKARDALDTAHDKFVKQNEIVISQCSELFELRSGMSKLAVSRLEIYVNSLAATPKEFDQSFQEYRVEEATFAKKVRNVEDAFARSKIEGGVGAGIGVAAGAATAFTAPTAAMAIATTFGTASTGTAISTLTGGVATKAALAWLGGGALSTGGAGVAGGQWLLTLAGPVGWGLVALSITGGLGYTAYKSASSASEALELAENLKDRCSELVLTSRDIQGLLGLTRRHTQYLLDNMVQLQTEASQNYREFTDEQKAALGALVNHVKVMGKLMNAEPGKYVP